MNIFLWILQILLALHTITGAVWKFSNSEATASLHAIPQKMWMALSVIEILCGLCLILPLFIKRLGILAPIAALVIAGEMLLFCAVQFYSGEKNNSQIIYWVVVAGVCVFFAYSRFKIKPIT
ncbi:MAG: hypothetical protein K0S53_2641 [Bacteroidetes bacterium]|jgi:hypothetical protein|nr:hypothetical protein [Bacteroidota bacterium]MDF2452820.1 hypothetical protein [Bacteroidota bacterium]